jgi:IS30 family transposase
MIQDRLNNLPRKQLGFKLLYESPMQSLNRAALRV